MSLVVRPLASSFIFKMIPGGQTTKDAMAGIKKSLKLFTIKTKQFYIDIFYLTISILLILAGLIWVMLIFKGYTDLDRLPVTGDAVNINFEGLDVTLGLSLLVMYVCPYIWAGLTVMILIYNKRKLSIKSFIIGVIGIVLNIVIIFSPQFRWIVD